MRQLNGVYTQRFNRHHGRVGHVFQGRYKAILVDREPYLLEFVRYVVLNTVPAGMVTSPEPWRWSSDQATAGQIHAPDWLAIEWVLRQFGTRRTRAAVYRFYSSWCPSCDRLRVALMRALLGPTTHRSFCL